jgi:hypothetical protein
MKIAKFLLSVKDECNQHLQTELKHISIKKGLKICRQLEKITDKDYVLEVWTSGSYCIYEKDTWKVGEHPLGHRDRLICSVDNK